MNSPFGHAQFIVALILPVDEEYYKLLQTKGFHIAVVDDVETKVEQSFVLSSIGLKHRTDIELQLVKHLFIDIAVRVNKVTEQLIVFDSL